MWSMIGGPPDSAERAGRGRKQIEQRRARDRAGRFMIPPGRDVTQDTVNPMRSMAPAEKVSLHAHHEPLGIRWVQNRGLVEQIVGTAGLDLRREVLKVSLLSVSNHRVFAGAPSEHRLH